MALGISGLFELEDNRRATAVLARTAALLDSIGNNSPDPIYAKDINGRFLYANPSVLAVIGKSADAVLGHTDAEWHSDPVQAAAIMANDLRIMESGVAEVFEETFDTANKGMRTFRSTKTPFYRDDGSVIGIVCISSDITDLKWAEEAHRLAKVESEFRILAEAMPQIVWITRADGWNIFFNKKWVEYTGLPLEESYGHGWNKPFHPDDQKRAWDAWQNAVNNNGTYSLECRLRRADGAYRWWLVRGVPLINESGAIEKWFGTCTDIHDLTWRKQVEFDLRMAKAEAERANLAKSKFLAAASHDLRQPIHALVLLLDVLKRHANTPPVAKAVDAMESALDGLNRLLSSILDVSRIDAGVVVPLMQSVDVGGLVQRICAEYALLCRQKSLRLRCRCKPSLLVRTDAVQIERILRNLIENAIRYTDRGGLLVATRRRGDRLRIDIVDSGIGIPTDKLEHIFEEFYQVGNPSRNYQEGLGLGLAIVRRLATLIGADVQVRSREGRGTCFTVTAPIDGASIDEMSTPSATAAVVTGRRIMVIEDNPKIRIGLELLLESWRCDVLGAKSGEEALVIGEKEGWRFDAIIADHRLGPGLSGTATAVEIGKRSGRSIPTLIVTGDTAPERISEIHSSGFEVMHKPVMPNELGRRMAWLLRGCAGE